MKKIMFMPIILLFILMILGETEVKAALISTKSRSFSSVSGGGTTLNLNSIAGTTKNMTASDNTSTAWDILENDRSNVYCTQHGNDCCADTYRFSNFRTTTNSSLAYIFSVGKNTYYRNDVSQNLVWADMDQATSYTGGDYSKELAIARGIDSMSSVGASITGTSTVYKVLQTGECVVGPFRMYYPNKTVAGYQLGYLESVIIKGYLQSDAFVTPSVISTSNWKYCNASGNNISTPSSGSAFYIKLSNNVKRLSDIVITTKQLRVTATYIAATASKSQNMYFVKSYNRSYVTDTATFNPWLNTTGTAKIRKVDYDNKSQGLGGAKFIIQSSGLPSSTAYVMKRGNSISFTSKANATVFTSDSNGYITIEGLPVGKYYCNETIPPPPTYKYIDPAAQVVFNVTGGTSVNSVTVTNQVKTGNLKLEKVDYDLGNVLNSAEMVVYKKVGGVNQYVVSTTNTTLPTFTTNINSAKKFKSGSIIYNLLAGTYYVKETKTHNEMYTVVAPETSIYVNRNSTVTKTIRNKRMIANLQIEKKDYDKGTILSGAQFVVYKMVGSTKNYVYNCYNSTTQITTYTTSIGSAKKFDTGQIVYNLVFEKTGTTYYIEEIKTPSIYYPIFPSTNIQSVLLTESYRLKNVTKTFVNTKYVANLTITKTDQDTRKPLNGVEFQISRLDTKTNRIDYIYVSGTTAQATSGTKTLYTNSSGQIVIKDLVTKVPQSAAGQSVYDYRYRVREISNNVKDYDGDYIYHGYRGYPDDSYYDSGWFTFSRLENKNLSITNLRQIIDFKGYAWEEKQTNNLYGSGDKLLPGITVKLINTKTNEIIETQKTGSDGSYKFNNINLPSIRQYSSNTTNKLNVKIVFEYDGFEYEAVNYSTASNGSKAIESAEERMALNQGFAQLTGTGTTDRTYSYFRDDSGEKTYRVNYFRGQVPSAMITPLK